MEDPKKTRGQAPEEIPVAKTPKQIAAALGASGKSLEEMETKLVGGLAALKHALKGASASLDSLEDDRKRENDAWNYKTQQERQGVLDAQKREDEERNKKFEAREAIIRESETEFAGLLKMTGPVDKASLRAAFALHVANVEKAAEGKATAMATTKFEQEKKLAAAEGATAGALLKAENERLKKENEELKAQNNKLLDAQVGSVTSMKELAAEGLRASAGQVNKATEMMNTAASGPGFSRPPR